MCRREISASFYRLRVRENLQLQSIYFAQQLLIPEENNFTQKVTCMKFLMDLWSITTLVVLLSLPILYLATVVYLNPKRR
uniref:Uncharacterized protein n=1 Tax=Arundo donax TaxID=35708 RepID=A0A0A9GHQ1_ARUDO